MRVVFFLIDTVFFVLVAAALLRAWLNAAHVSMAVQPGPFLLALTNWIVMPLRKLLPQSWQRSRWDCASLVGAAALAFTQALLLWSLGAGMLGMAWLEGGWLPLGLAVRLLVGTALQGLFLLLLLHAVLSWVQPQSPVYAWLSRLMAPLLAPVRRHLPLVGGVDLSPLVLLLAVQVALMLVG
jgi:YggT family protein